MTLRGELARVTGLRRRKPDWETGDWLMKASRSDWRRVYRLTLSNSLA
jgi:hypothetical protein